MVPMRITRIQLLEEQLEAIEDELRTEGRSRFPQIPTGKAKSLEDAYARLRALHEQARILVEWSARKAEVLARRDRYQRELAQLRRKAKEGPLP